MKVISVTQPWASYLAQGRISQILRADSPHQRRLLGQRVAIHGGSKNDPQKRMSAEDRQVVKDQRRRRRIANNAVVGVARITNGLEIVAVGRNRQTGKTAARCRVRDSDKTVIVKLDTRETPAIGMWLWIFEEAYAFPQPLPVKGRKGIWEWEGPGSYG